MCVSFVFVVGVRGWWRRRGSRLEVVMHQRLEARALRPHFIPASSLPTFSLPEICFLGELQGAQLRGSYGQEEGELEGEVYACMCV